MAMMPRQVDSWRKAVMILEGGVGDGSFMDSGTMRFYDRFVDPKHGYRDAG
jgi:hypothetical protein